MNNWSISRRTFLRGTGVMLSLPLLDIMALQGRAATKNAYLPPTRMGVVLFPNGVRPSTWFSKEEGTIKDLPAALKPFEKVKEDILLFSGLSNDLCKEAPHHRAIAGFLTGSYPKEGSPHVGISADQYAARRIGQHTRLASLELGLPETLQQQGSCDGYSCVYTRNIAWNSPTTPVPKEINPRNAFDRLFRDLVNKAEKGKDELSAQTQNRDDKSVLDLVLNDAKSLRNKVSEADKQKLDQYFESVRDVETRIDRIIVPETHRGGWKASRPDKLVAPSTPQTIQEHIYAMFDLMALAFQTDSTRIATLMMGYGASWNVYPESGIKEQHHTISHYPDAPGKGDIYTQLNQYHASCFTYLVQKLKSIPEGNGTLLDNCMILFGSELGQGGSHIVHNLPLILAGKAGGTIQTGRHIKMSSHTPMSNLLLEMLNRMQLGETLTRFGDSSGGLPGLAT
ncbi:MAG: hypothetical protein JWN25_1438 [Verrucomicrobiales bacterium]|nr:hypothetical protein [Verrucomicrobiales bacterium]MDB6131216.1 hypothetical protein [Verrucomicrobiales bacterium]